MISGADVQQLTDILAGKGIPADADIAYMHCPECGLATAEGANYCQ